MKLFEFDIFASNHFIAMEYYMLMLNRTFLVLITKDYLVGIKGNGIISVQNDNDILTTQITRSISVTGELDNPFSYLKRSYLDRALNTDLFGPEFFKADKSNFRIARSDIRTAHYNPAKKLGMGPYPHDGRVIIETIDNKRREFIILGNQSGQVIADKILQR